MSIPGAASPLFLGAAVAEEAAYQIDRSLRFNTADTSNLERNPSSVGNRRTLTMSFWIKLTGGGTYGVNSVLEAGLSGSGSTQSGFSIRFDADQKLQIFEQNNNSITWQVQTSAVYRDYSSWYHVVIALDTTQSTAADRVKIWVNGEQVTSFSTASYPSQNYESNINKALPHRIGASDSGGSPYLPMSAYLADVHFIDGQALAPTDFGEYDSNNVWQPKEFAGTYEFTPTVEVGSPSYPSDFTSTGNKTSDQTGLSFGSWSGSFTGAQTKIFKTSDTSAFDLTISLSGGTNDRYLWYSNNATDWTYVGNIASLGNPYTLSGYKYYATSEGSNSTTLTATAVTQGANSFRLDFSDNSSDQALGYDAAVTAPTLNPRGGMDVITYTGNGSTQTIGGLAFQPDFLWIKSRTGSNKYHTIADSVRGKGSNGAYLRLFSNTTSAELNDGYDVTDITSDGFSLTNGSYSNTSSENYVAWAWKAGGPAVLNEDGSIDSQVSVSTDYGFSIVSWEGNGSSSATVGHGLSSTPKWVIVKGRETTDSWSVHHTGLTSGHVLLLNSTGASFSASTAGGGGVGAPTSSTLTFINGTSSVNNVNQSTKDFIAYCWSEVSGFSKFGSYTGNGSTNGPTITTGFKPRYILIKADIAGEDWVILDTARDSVNPVDQVIFANTADVEFTNSAYNTEFQVDGFQLKNTNPRFNTSGETYIYAAFADRPGNNWTPNNLIAEAGFETASQGMDVVTYSGTSSTQSISSLAFQPDFIWIKNRSKPASHHLYDVVRGVSERLRCDRTDVADTAVPITSFDSNGFTLPADVTDAINTSSSNYVAWCWNAGANSNKTYTVKVVSDSGNKYRFDDFGTSAVTLDLAEGSTYVFDQSDSSNSGHPLRFSTTSDGTHNSGSEYTTGVTVTGTPGTAGAKTTIVVGSGVATLYYYCSVHSGMGGQANTNSTAGASNFDGSIQATTKANTTYGFSIVSYTGNLSSAGVSSVGHGLNDAPSLVITKRRNGTSNWVVQHISTSSASQILFLDTTDAQYSVSANGTLSRPTSTVFSVNYSTGLGVNGQTHIAYCWSEVPGFSRFGSYTGNGSSTGPVITTGFKVRFLLVKRTDSTANWRIIDTERGAKELYPSLNNAEQAFDPVTYTNDGFQIKVTDSNYNASGGTYIYAAFADKPPGEIIDSLIDTPTNYEASSGNNGGNYCTLNPLANSGLTLSNGNLDFTSSGGNRDTCIATHGVFSGKWYWEVTVGDNAIGVGIEPEGYYPASDSRTGLDSAGYSWWLDRQKKYNNNGTNTSYGASVSSGDVIGVALDLDGGTLTFYKNNSSQGTAFTGISGTYLPAISDVSNALSMSGNINFGARPFAYTPPTGYKSLCTTNLTDPTIADGSTAMDVKLYTGNSGTQTISGLGFSPDLLWIKSRSVAYSHRLFDTVRGVTKALYPDLTEAEGAAQGTNENLTAFTSDGFSLGSASGIDAINNNNVTFATWAWDGGTTTATNTDGSITSNVRANASAGFSIISYTGDGSGTDTIGHGLNDAPSLVITKSRGTTGSWRVFTDVGGTWKLGNLNNTDAFVNATVSAPTSSVFSIDGNSNASTTHIAYCFAPVSQYSAFGVYTGNGSSDGPMVFTGFRPRWILYKGTASSNWTLHDTARGEYNIDTKRLYPHLSNAEQSTSDLDILSNGFKLRQTGSDSNSSGATYIYAAFAEHPFKTARAR